MRVVDGLRDLADTEAAMGFRLSLVCASLLALFACSHTHQPPPAASPPPLLIDERGITMPLSQVVTHISYRPWIPPRQQILKFAVIPPLGNQDSPANRGVAVEYQAGPNAMLLSEWPKQNFTLLFLHNQNITFTPCKIARYKSDGVAWTTHRGLAMTLQPDGSASASTVDTQARDLIAQGACQ
jgi:hypothetical protein